MREKLSLSKTAVFMLIVGTVWFSSGLHAIDTAWNMNYVQCVTGQEFSDLTVYGLSYEKDQIYRNGVNSVFTGFFLSLFSSLYIGVHFHYRRNHKMKYFLQSQFFRRIRHRSRAS